MGWFVPVVCYGFCMHWLVCKIVYSIGAMPFGIKRNAT